MNWVDTFRHSNSSERRQMREYLLEGTKATKNGQVLYKALTNDMKFYGFAAYLIMIPYGQNKFVCHEFPSPHLLYTYKHFPAVVITAPQMQFDKEDFITVKPYNINSQVTEFLPWTKKYVHANPEEQRKMKSILLGGINEYDRTPGAGAVFHDAMTKDKQGEFKGFAISVNYFRERGDIDDMESIWIHPFGGPTLVYKLKDFNGYSVANPSLRVDDTHIREMKENRYNISVTGITD